MNAENVHVAQKGENILNEPAALGQPLSLREVKKKKKVFTTLTECRILSVTACAAVSGFPKRLRSLGFGFFGRHVFLPSWRVRVP